MSYEFELAEVKSLAKMTKEVIFRLLFCLLGFESALSSVFVLGFVSCKTSFLDRNEANLSC